MKHILHIQIFFKKIKVVEQNIWKPVGTLSSSSAVFGEVSNCSPVPTASAHPTGVYSSSAWGLWQLFLVSSDILIPRAFQNKSLKDFTLLTEFMRKMQRKKWKLRSIWREGYKLCFPWKPASLPTGYCCWAGMGMKSLTWETAGL